MTDDGQDSAEFGLQMPFWIDTDAYSDRDRLMFVCGVEFEMVYKSLVMGMFQDRTIHRENESRIRMMCGKMGIRCTIEPCEGHGDWSFFKPEPRS